MLRVLYRWVRAVRAARAILAWVSEVGVVWAFSVVSWAGARHRRRAALQTSAGTVQRREKGAEDNVEEYER